MNQIERKTITNTQPSVDCYITVGSTLSVDCYRDTNVSADIKRGTTISADCYTDNICYISWLLLRHQCISW